MNEVASPIGQGRQGADETSLAAHQIALARVREEERNALAREMHDEIGGSLGAARLMLAALRRRADAPELDDHLAEIEQVLVDTSSAADRIVRALRPAALERGVVSALQHEVNEFSRRHRTEASFTSNREHLELPQGHALTLYRICQEALSNVARHARAAQVDVTLFRDTGSITLEVRDNGQGFDTSALVHSARLGVAGMRERARSFGGWIEIDSASGRGTTLMLQMPLRRVADARL